MSDEDGEQNSADLLREVKCLHHQCDSILKDFHRWDIEKPIQGLHRYLHLLNAEIQFLERMMNDPSAIRPKYMESTNVHYLEAFHQVMAAVRAEEVMKIKDVPPTESNQWMSKVDRIKLHSVKVDLIAAEGLIWIKVIARNAKALRHEMDGLELSDEEDSDDLFDGLPIFQKAREYLRTAEAHHVHFRFPKVVFAFMRIQPNEDEFIQRIMDKLTTMGIHVQLPGMEWLPLIRTVQAKELTTTKTNLDVSTVMTLLSELVHHPCTRDQVESEALQLQADKESVSPVLPILHHYLQNKELFMVQTAYETLKKTVYIVGGDTEKRRFDYLFRSDPEDLSTFDQELWTLLPSLHVQILPDYPSEQYLQLLSDNNGVTRNKKLNNGHKIRTGFKNMHAIIFGSGDHYKMTTFTGVQWMRTALEEAGIFGTAIVMHEPRSLAEEKMKNSQKNTCL